MIFKTTRTVRPQGTGTRLSRLSQILSFRRRALLTRKDHLRLRYIVSPLALAAFAGGVALWQSAPLSSVAPDMPNAAQLASVDADQAGTVYSFYHKRLERYEQDAAQVVMGQAAPAPVSPPSVQTAQNTVPTGPAQPRRPFIRILKIGAGDTMTGLLKKAGIAADDAYRMVQAIEHTYNMRHLKVGQKLAVQYGPVAPGAANAAPTIAQIDMPIDVVHSVSLQKTADGGFKTQMVQKPVETRVYARSARVESSLYASASKSGIPSDVVAELIKTYSYDVDFQRDLHQGDVAQVLYSQVQTKSGDFVKTGDLLFARLVVGGRVMPIYQYESNGVTGYFTPDGKSIRKALMRTPVDGARISSGFGMRMHPVLGFTKMHKGVDFAAPIGTPIYAAGNGVVEKCGPFSTYGNYIKIRHNASMETAYAHMNGFAAGIRAGDRVHQGEVIGYIGRTGRVTGAHLHYEVLIGGNQVNPASIKVAQNDQLAGRDLSQFRARVARINQQYTTLTGGLKTASRDNGSSVQ